MPAPPALVITPTRGPAGIGWVESIMATSISCSSVSVRMTPACSKSASTATSRLARAAEWLDAARVPAAERPDLTATIGLRRATLRKSMIWGATRARVRARISATSADRPGT